MKPTDPETPAAGAGQPPGSYHVVARLAHAVYGLILLTAGVQELRLHEDARTAMALIAEVDVVFCRNVMIYFAPESRKRLLDTLIRKMRPGAYLLLGHSESLINVSTGFELLPLQNDIVYRKPTEENG